VPGPWELPAPEPLWVQLCRFVQWFGVRLFAWLTVVLSWEAWSLTIEIWIRMNIASGFRW
jgi:hypothetical protein